MTKRFQPIAFLTTAFLLSASAMAEEPAARAASEGDNQKRLATYERNGKIGFVDARGRRITPAKYDGLRSVRNGIHVVMANGKRCAVNMAGEEFLPCEYDFITFPGDRRIMVRLRGEIFDVDSNGQRIGTPTPLPNPRRTASTTTSLAPSSAPPPGFNLARVYADQERWTDAVAEALKGSGEDKRYVLLALSRAGKRPAATDPATSDSYRRYSAGADAVRNNPGIFDDAMAGATAEQRQQLSAMRRQTLPSVDYGPVPGRQGNINARTVEECHSRGGTVSVMGYCR